MQTGSQVTFGVHDLTVSTFIPCWPFSKACHVWPISAYGCIYVSHCSHETKSLSWSRSSQLFCSMRTTNTFWSKANRDCVFLQFCWHDKQADLLRTNFPARQKLRKLNIRTGCSKYSYMKHTGKHEIITIARTKV